MTRIEWLTHDHFAPPVGDGFEMALDDGGTLPLELTEATTSAEPGGAGPDGQQRGQFSLVFRGPTALVVPQGTYLLAHEGLGELESEGSPMYVVAKEDGRWLLTANQNTPVLAD